MYPSKEMFAFKPLRQDNWKDFKKLFGKKGACGGCWCMHWRLNNKSYEANKGGDNMRSMKYLVKSDKPLGIIAYENEVPVGWCSISPRDSLERLKTSRYFKQVDNLDVWSISCLYILPEKRKKGLSEKLIKKACYYGRSKGARIIEAYPIVPIKGKIPDVFAWVGIAQSFERLGFHKVKKPSKTRAYMRYYCK